MADGLLDAITGGETSAAQNDLEQALAAIQGIQTPTAQEMQYQIQKEIQAGTITPEQAQTYLQSANALAAENVPQEGTQAQEEAITQTLSAADQGGLNPEEQAQIAQILQQLGTQESGVNQAAVQQQAERGALTGGETLAAQLQSNQNEAQNANLEGGNTAATAYQQMLNELSSAGSMGSALQGQENTQANTVAAATNAINQFNAAQQQGEANYNTTNANEAQAANVENLQNIGNTNTANENAYEAYQAQLPQEVYQDQLNKAAAEAGVSEQQAGQATTAGGEEAGLIGGLVGTAGDVVGNVYGAPSTTNPTTGHYAGGEIHDYLNGGLVKADRPNERAVVPGNSPKNDRIPASLSEGEVVLPRTVARNPQPDKVMDFLNRIRKPKTPHPDDVATVLHALGKVREVA
jgi:hypothetical protein